MNWSLIPPDWKVVTDLLEVFASWPVVGGVLFALFVRQFQAEIRTFLQNVKPNPPGVAQMAAPLSQPIDAPRPSAEVEDAPQLQEGNAAAEDAELEEFRYLNGFLVLTTQLILGQIARAGSLKVEDLGRLFTMHSLSEREAILRVLYQHGLVTAGPQAELVITEKGKRYCEWPERKDWVEAQGHVWLAAPPPPNPMANALHEANANRLMTKGGLFGRKYPNALAVGDPSQAIFVGLGGLYGLGAEAKAQEEELTREPKQES